MLRRELAARVLAGGGDVSPALAVSAYRRSRPDGHARLAEFMRSVERESGVDLATLLVAIRQVRVLVG